MMIFQIILGIIAWKRGWRWWVFLPLGIAVWLGLMVGVTFTNVDDIYSACFIVDALAIVALGLMVIFKKEK